MERRASSATPWQRDRSLCNRLVGITACLVIGFTIVSWRLYQLQLRQHEELSAAAYEKFHRDEPLPALRGAIRDRMGEYLAHDERCWELYVDRDHLKDNTRVCANYALMRKVPEAELKAKFTPAELFAAYTAESARRLAPEIGLAEEEVLAALRSKRHVEILRRELDEKTKDYLDHFLQSEHLFGIYTRGDVRRLYPAANRLALLLGRMVPGKGAISGLEKLCDEVLTGIPGERSIERDRVGFELPQYRGEVTPPQDGADVFTSIDMNLQEITEVILERAFLEYSPENAIAILVDPLSGEVLSMACRPYLDIETMKGNWRNMPVSDAYEPGSVMKIVTISAALDAGLVSPDTPIDCGHGVYSAPELKGWDLHDCSTRLGVQPVSGVLSHSSNIGTYKIARMLGAEGVRNAMERFGFGRATGIGLTQESAGSLKPVEDWNAVNLSRGCIGYFITATALQQVMAYAAIANRGILLQPRLIDRVVYSDGRVQTFPPQPVGRACSERTAEKVTAMLEGVVKEGSGKRAAIEGVRVAGKTGTRNVYDPHRNAKGEVIGYRRDQQVVSFAGFAPVEAPRVACVVMVNNPKVNSPELQQGGLVAAPIFSELVTAALDYLEVRLDPHASVSTTAFAPSPGGTSP